MRKTLFVALLCTGCAVGPDYERPDIALPDAYRTGFSSGDATGPWWNGFNDDELDRLMGRALDQNLNVAAAEARLARAEAFITAERADLLPTVDGDVSANTARNARPSANAGLSAIFTPDLFGDRRRELAAAMAVAEGARSDVSDARRLTAGSLASGYVELRRTDARIALLNQSLELQQQTLRIVRLRADTGLAADLDVQRATADLANTRAQRGPLAASRADADYLISLLSGVAPGSETVPVTDGSPVPVFEAGPSIEVPASLLRNRADVRASELGLIAATERIGGELADLYPALNLSGVLSTRIDGSDLAGQTTARAAAVLNVPLVDLGRRRADVRAARADADAALATYELTLLSALRDVEAALADIEAAEAQRSDFAAAVRASSTAFDQLQALYTEGLATLIDVLDAQRQLIASRERFTDSEASLAQSYVRLYEAVGGSLDG